MLISSTWTTGFHNTDIQLSKDEQELMRLGIDFTQYCALSYVVKPKLLQAKEEFARLMQMGMAWKEFAQLKSQEQVFILEYGAAVCEILASGTSFPALMRCANKRNFIQDIQLFQQLPRALDFDDFSQLSIEAQEFLMNNQDLLELNIHLKSFDQSYLREIFGAYKNNLKKLLEAGVSFRQLAKLDFEKLKNILMQADQYVEKLGQGEDFSDLIGKK